MEVCRRSSWLLPLLGVILFAEVLQGVQDKVEIEGPSESECRPYIEKALRELEHVATEDGTGSTEEPPSIDDLKLDEEPKDEPSAEKPEPETTSQESQEKEVATSDDVEQPTQTDAKTDESNESEDTQDTAEELEKAQDQQSQEDKATDGSPEGESAEEIKEQAQSVEEAGSLETASVETAESVASEEQQTTGDESLEAPEEVAPEDSDGGSKSEETKEEQTDTAESEKSDEKDEQEDQKTESDEKTEAVDDQDSTTESDEQAQEAAASVEDTDAKESGEDAQSKEGQQEESTEKAEDSSSDRAKRSVEDSVDDDSAEKEEDEGKTEEVQEEGTEGSIESEQLHGNSEKATESVEKESSDEEGNKPVSEEIVGTEATDGTPSTEEKDSKETKEDESKETKEAESKETKEDESKENEENVKDTKETKEDESKETKEDESKENEENVKDSKETKEDESKETKEDESKESKVDESKESKETKEGDTDENKTAEDEDDNVNSEQSIETGENQEKAEGDASVGQESAEEAPEEDLTLEADIPKDLRPRDHVEQLLKIDREATKTEEIIDRISEITLRDLKRLYENAIKPLETLYKYRDLSNRHYGDAEIFSKPLILFMGPWSGGKSSIVNYLLNIEYNDTALHTGAEPSPAYFNLLMYGEEKEILDGTQLAADYTFSGLQKFGQGLEERLRGVKLPSKLLEKVNLVEIPGILEVRKQVSRVFPFNDACQWFIDRADIIFLVYDPSKLDVGPETEAILDQLKGREYQTRIVLNKADLVKPEELMRVQGALIWNISPLMSSPQPPIMYTTSLWSRPYEPWAPVRLLQAQERAFLRDLRSAIDRRIENKIASARRFAVRVRNHAKMVDCYLTTYYNHKSIFGNKKKVSDEIIEHPQDYHIYEGLSTLTNISRYDLPDPDVYKDFFRLNPLYEFQQLSATCTYFRGCPINKLDVAIAYDLPELVGKHKRNVEAALAESNQDQPQGS